MAVFEVCVESLDAAIAAELGGADRIELCSSLIEGGITPSLGLIRAVRSRVKFGVYVLIRPGAGDFFYSADEFAVMQADITLARESGADGVVLGVLTSEGAVDVERTKELVRVARPMEVTFHRAIDVTRDIRSAVEDVVLTGADRILSSGGHASAMEGRFCLGDMVKVSAGRIGVMAGGGVGEDNVQQIAEASGVSEFHASLRTSIKNPVQHQSSEVHLGERSVVLVENVRNMRRVISGG
jgi:copper homeostasis protein